MAGEMEGRMEKEELRQHPVLEQIFQVTGSPLREHALWEILGSSRDGVAPSAL